MIIVSTLTLKTAKLRDNKMYMYTGHPPGPGILRATQKCTDLTSLDGLCALNILCNDNSAGQTEYNE